MGFADKYLATHKSKNIYLQRPWLTYSLGFPSICVAIPAFSEENIFKPLESLKACQPCKKAVEVHILVNYSEAVSDTIKKDNYNIYNDLISWCKKNSCKWLKFYPYLTANLPGKHAGAGFARKIIMDQVIERLNAINCPDAIILSMDADASVTANYLGVIEEVFATNHTLTGCTINFEHPVKGKDYPAEVYSASVLYEIYLRYFKQALQYIGFPFAHYTIGSCFGVRAKTYIKHGGMNRKQGGEDFYFLHKLFPHEKFRFITETTVFPSPRPSWRVPFGTGPAIRKIINNGLENYQTYNPESFIHLKSLIEIVPQLYQTNTSDLTYILEKLEPPIQDYLKQINVKKKIVEINSNTASEQAFVKRFFQFFNAFQIIKLLNFCREKYYPDINILEAGNTLLKWQKKGVQKTSIDLLFKLREHDMNNEQ